MRHSPHLALAARSCPIYTVVMEQERTPSKTGSGGRVCPNCGAAFTCGIAAGESRCWCFDLPPVMPVRADTACLCPACLAQAIRQTQETDVQQ
jgi:hypothetical protein